MKKIVESVSLIYAVLVFIGYAQLHVYYGAFKIPIWSYMTIGEVLLLFIPLTIPLVATLGIFAVMLILSNAPESLSEWLAWTRKRQTQKPGFVSSDRRQEKEPRWVRLIQALWHLFELVMICWFGFVVARIFGEIQGADNWSSWNEAQRNIGIWSMVLLVMAIIKTLGDNKRLWMQLWTWGMLGLGVLTICAWSAKRARSIMTGKPEYRAVLYTNQGVVESDTCFYYVGRCDNVTFFWDKESGEWTTIKNTEVFREDLTEVNPFPKPFD